LSSPLRPAQVTDISQKFKDEVNAFKSNQGAY